jgi:hypothetical protein
MRFTPTQNSLLEDWLQKHPQPIDPRTPKMPDKQTIGKVLGPTQPTPPQEGHVGNCLTTLQKRKSPVKECKGQPADTMTVAGQQALQDMVELQMYLVAQPKYKPWPMVTRRLKKHQQDRMPYSNPVESSAVKELMDHRLIEATSGRTFVVSKSGHEYYERENKRISA